MFLTCSLLLAVAWLVTPGDAQNCGATLTGGSGTFTSPNYPGTYPANRLCTWTVRVAVGMRVRLLVSDLDIQGSVTTQCSLEYLQIRDGSNRTSPLLQELCGRLTSFTARSFGNSLTVVFRSYLQPAGKGFSATYMEDSDETFLLVSGTSDTSHGAIFLLDTLTKGNYAFHTDTLLYTPVALTYDPVEGKVYWSEVDSDVRGIKSSYLNGSQPTFVQYSENAESQVEGLAVDQLSRLLIYTDSLNKRIGMISLRTGDHRTIINGTLDKPKSIAVHKNDGIIFWTDRGSQPRIERAYYDGTGQMTLVSFDLLVVNSLAIDATNNRLFWVDGGTDRVEVSDLYGNNRRTLVQARTSSVHYFGLALVGNVLYITDQGYSHIVTGSLSDAVLTGRSNMTLTSILFTSLRLYDIHGYQLHTAGANGCGSTNGGCSDFCLPLTQNGSQCACPDGQALASDNRTCEFWGPRPPVRPSTPESGCNRTLAALNGTITSPNFPNDYPNLEYCEYQISVPAGYRITLTFTVFGVEEDEAGGCTYDYVQVYEGIGAGKTPISNRICGYLNAGAYRSFENNMTIVFYSDTYVRGIGFKASYTTDTEVGFFLVTTSLVVGNHYFGDLVRADARTFANHLIPMALPVVNPLSVAYDPMERRVYWTEDAPVYEIRSAALSGGPVTVVRMFDTGSVLYALALDPLTRCLFYTNAAVKTMTMVSLSNNSSKTIISSDLDKPRAIVLDTKNGLLYWTDRGLFPKIERANYDGTERRVLVNTSISGPTGMAIDFAGRRLFWLDTNLDQLESCDLEGGMRQVMLQLGGDHGLAGLALWNNALYVTANRVGSGIYSRAVGKLPLGPPVGNYTLVLRSSMNMLDIHVYQQGLSPADSNGCERDNGGCVSPSMCVPRPNNTSICTCPDAYYQVVPNKCELNDSLTTLAPSTRTTPPLIGCNGENYTALSGTLTSPGFPKNYPSGMDCVYQITAPKDYRLKLSFTTFALERSLDCSFDFLEIRDGTSSAGRLLAKVCGTDLPGPFKSFTNGLWVRFRTDSSWQGTGFKAAYTADQDKSFFLVTRTKRSGLPDGSIFRLDMDTLSNYAISFNVRLQNPVAVVYDPVTERIYWAEVDVINVIRSANLSGGNVTTILDLGIEGKPEGLALDRLSRLLFYTDAERQEIGMVALSGNFRRSVVNQGLDKPRAIALDSKNGVVFWSNLGTSNTIESVNYDGTGRRILVNALLASVNALAIDMTNRRLYWVDAGTDRVESVTLDGLDRMSLQFFSQRRLYGLTLFNDVLYFTDHGNNTASGPTQSWIIRQRINLNNGTPQGNASVIASHPDFLNNLHAYYEHPTNTDPNGCGSDNGGNCSHFCVPLPGNQSKCMCPDDAEYSLVANKTCRFVSELTTTPSAPPTPVAASCSTVMRASTGFITSPNYPGNYPHHTNCTYQILLPGLNRRIVLNFTDFALEFSPICMYDYLEIRDGHTQSAPVIGRYCGVLKPFVVKSFTSSVFIFFRTDSSLVNRGFTLQYSEDTDTSFLLVARASHDSALNVGYLMAVDPAIGYNITLPVAERLYRPLAIDYDLDTGRIYWTEAGVFDGIRSALLDGSDVRDIRTDPLSVTEGLALDPASRLLFYTDGGNDVIGAMSLTTLDHKTIISTQLSKPKSIALDFNNGVIFWSSYGTVPKIERADYDGANRKTLREVEIQTVNGLAFDMLNNKLYWADATTDKVEAMSVDGTGYALLLELPPQFHFNGLALQGNTLFLTALVDVSQAQSPSVLLRLALDQPMKYEEVGRHSAILYGLHVVDPAQPLKPNGCSSKPNNGGCAKMCFPLPGGNRKCACPDGWDLQANGVQCSPSSVTPSTASTPDVVISYSSHTSSSPSAVGGAVGGVLAVLLVIGLIAVIFIVFRKRRAAMSAMNGGATPRPQGLDNPAYGANPVAMHDVMGAEGFASYDMQPDTAKHNTYYKLEEDVGTDEPHYKHESNDV